MHPAAQILQEGHLRQFRSRRSQFSTGFTLLELLVAVAILGIALLAIFKALTQSSQSLEEIRLRRLAGWVAENRAAEMRARKAFPDPGSKDEGEEVMGSVRFRWREEFFATPNASFIRMETAVREGDRDNPELVRQVSFLRRNP